MAAPVNCTHSYTLIKSDTTLILWNCQACYTGPHWYIYECKHCKFKSCQSCTYKDSTTAAAATSTTVRTS